MMPALRKKLQSAARQIDLTLAAGVNESPAASAGEQAGDADQAEIQRRLRTAQQLYHRIDMLLSSDLLAGFL
jgi:hypothetical protein